MSATRKTPTSAPHTDPALLTALDDLRAKFTVFGEAVGALDKKVQGFRDELHELRRAGDRRLDRIERGLAEHGRAIEQLRSRHEELRGDIRDTRTDIRDAHGEVRETRGDIRETHREIREVRATARLATALPTVAKSMPDHHKGTVFERHNPAKVERVLKRAHETVSRLADEALERG